MQPGNMLISWLQFSLKVSDLNGYTCFTGKSNTNTQLQSSFGLVIKNGMLNYCNWILVIIYQSSILLVLKFHDSFVKTMEFKFGKFEICAVNRL